MQLLAVLLPAWLPDLSVSDWVSVLAVAIAAVAWWASLRAARANEEMASLLRQQGVVYAGEKEERLLEQARLVTFQWDTAASEYKALIRNRSDYPISGLRVVACVSEPRSIFALNPCRDDSAVVAHLDDGEEASFSLAYLGSNGYYSVVESNTVPRGQVIVTYEFVDKSGRRWRRENNDTPERAENLAEHPEQANFNRPDRHWRRTLGLRPTRGQRRR